MSENKQTVQMSSCGIIATILMIVATATGAGSMVNLIYKFSEGAAFLSVVAFLLGLAGAAMLTWFVLCPTRRLFGMVGGWLLTGMSAFSLIATVIDFEIWHFLPVFVELGATAVLAVWMLLVFGGRNHGIVGKLWFLPAVIGAGSFLFALISMIVSALDGSPWPDARFAALLTAALVFFGLFLKEEVAKMPAPAPKPVANPYAQLPYGQMPYAQQNPYAQVPYAQQNANPYAQQAMPAQPVEQPTPAVDGANLPNMQENAPQNTYEGQQM